MAILNEAMKKRSIKIMLDALDKAPNTEKALLTTKLKDLGVDVPAFVIPPPKSSINEDAFNVRNLGILERSAALPRRADVFPDIYETKELDRRINALKPLVERDVGESGIYDATMREGMSTAINDDASRLALKKLLDNDSFLFSEEPTPALLKDRPVTKIARDTYLDVANPQPKKPIIDMFTDIIEPNKEKVDKPSKLTAENLGNIYKYILLPAMGIAETISSKGRSPGTNALNAMSAFEAGYEGRKAKELGDLKIAEAKKESARKDALRKQLEDLDSYKIATQADIDAINEKDVLSDIEKTAMEQGFDKVENVPLGLSFGKTGTADNVITVPVRTSAPSPMVPLSSKVISDRKRAALAKQLGVTDDKLVASQDILDERAQNAIENFVKATDPLAYMKLKNDKSEARRNKELMARQNYMAILSSKDASEPMKIDAAFQYFTETGKAPAIAPSAEFTDPRMKQMYPRENIALGTQALAGAKFEQDVEKAKRDEERFNKTFGLQQQRLDLDRAKMLAEQSKGSKLTESQSKDIGFAGTIYKSVAEMTDILSKGKYDPTSVEGLLSPFLPTALKKTEQQLFENAARKAVYAALRKESGAAISVPEEKAYIEMNTPKFGDSAELIAKKLSDLRERADAISSGIPNDKRPVRSRADEF